MAAAQWLGAVPVPVYADSVADEMAYVLAHAEVTHAVVQDQEQVDKLLAVAERVPTLKHLLYDEERGLRDYDHARLHALTEVIDEGRKRLDAGPEAAALLDRELDATARLRPRHHPLHLGHDRPPEGRDAVLRQRREGLRDRLRLRQADRGRRDHRLSADRLGRRPHLLLRAGDPRRALRQLPGKPRHRGRGPARDRHHLRLRPAARVREHAHPHHGADGGRQRDQAADVQVLHRPREPGRREDPQSRAGRESLGPAALAGSATGSSMRR